MQSLGEVHNENSKCKVLSHGYILHIQATASWPDGLDSSKQEETRR